MRLAAVIVFYNPSEENVKYISDIENYIDKLYVVDNSDDDIFRIESSDKINYIKLCENKGIAYALNLGAEKAICDEFRYLLTLDQDTKINIETINEMKKYLMNNKDEKVGLISPYQDIGCDNNESLKNDVEDVIEVMTSGNIIDLEIYKKINGFKDWLFIDCVDTDYCMNLHKHGYRVLRLNYLRVKHELGCLVVHRLLKKNYPCFNHNPIRRYYIVRNNLYIKKMYDDIFPEYCNKLIRIQKGQVKRIIVFEKQKIKKLKMMHKGYKDYKKGIKGKLKNKE